MSANISDLRGRAKCFALEIINLVKGLPRNIATDAIARQLIRAGTGVSANFRAAGRVRSRREFVARLAVVVEEADEAELWLEALLKCALARPLRWIRSIAERPSCARFSASRYIPRVRT